MQVWPTPNAMLPTQRVSACINNLLQSHPQVHKPWWHDHVSTAGSLHYCCKLLLFTSNHGN